MTKDDDEAVDQIHSDKVSSDTYIRHKARLSDHLHLGSLFGDNWFAVKAEGFARFFGTPLFLVAQTLIVVIWISLNVFGWTKFDLYPFILLNLAFSLQAAYAAPLILLAQTRQADRERMRADLEALHREDLAQSNEKRLVLMAEYNKKLMVLLQQNTELTSMNKELCERIELMTQEIHKKMGRH